MEVRIPRGDFDSIDSSPAVVNIDQFHIRSSEHRPVTTCRVSHGPQSIHLRFDVRDKFVRCVHKGFQSAVWKDSCVEFFVQPKPDSGYFNIETNCGGEQLIKYIKDPYRNEKGGVMNARDVKAEEGATITVKSLLTVPYESVGDEEIDWWVLLSIPVDFMENYVGPIGDLTGQTWRANFYKCGDKTNMPHYASWSPIGEKLEFHQPAKFGTIIFE
ncbi:carbohydrate-binding family 9-like protein [soil metagenome]